MVENSLSEAKSFSTIITRNRAEGESNEGGRGESPPFSSRRMPRGSLSADPQLGGFRGGVAPPHNDKNLWSPNEVRRKRLLSLRAKCAHFVRLVYFQSPQRTSKTSFFAHFLHKEIWKNFDEKRKKMEEIWNKLTIIFPSFFIQFSNFLLMFFHFFNIFF